MHPPNAKLCRLVIHVSLSRNTHVDYALVPTKMRFEQQKLLQHKQVMRTTLSALVISTVIYMSAVVRAHPALLQLNYVLLLCRTIGHTAGGNPRTLTRVIPGGILCALT